MAEWDELLQLSEDHAFQDGFPHIERNLKQVEQLSLKLRSKASRANQSEEAFAASRLLADQGFNSRRYNRELLELELQPTHEDVFDEGPTTVDSYLQEVHTSTVISAIQETQRQTDDTFQQFMSDSMQSQWQAAKRRLLGSMLPSGSNGGFSAGGFSTALATPGADQQAGGQKVQLSGRFRRYAEVTADLNAAGVSGRQFQAIAEYTAACVDEETLGGGMSMRMCWQLLQSIAPGHASSSNSVQQLISPALDYLQQGHASYMLKAIQADRAQAALGGNPSRLSKVHAFLRIKNRDTSAVLDFDSPAGSDTTWQRIFCCMRSGYYDEAVSVAQSCSASAAPRPGGKDFAGHLSVWSRSNHRLSPQSAAALAPEIERLLREGRDVRQRPPFWAQKVACHVILAADARLGDQLQREVDGLFPTIEDYMWFQLALIRSAPSDDDGGGPAVAGVQVATLEGLQQYLCQFPPGHYSHQGKEPLLYAMVLLLSLQLRGCVSYLASDAATKAYRVDAVHLALALHSANLLDTAGEGEAGSAMDVGAFVLLYARQFVHTDVQLALEYYFAAARVQGNTTEVQGRLLRELLTESHAYGFLLGSGGAGGAKGALAALVPDMKARRALVAAAAEECAAAAQADEAVELFMYAGEPRHALHILTHQLSDLAEAAADDSVAASSADDVEQRGAAAAAALVGCVEKEDTHQLEAFSHLKTIRRLLLAHARGLVGNVSQLLLELPFVPLEGGRVAVCSARAPMLHPAILDLLPKVLTAAAFALEQQRRPDALRAVSAFADKLPSKIPTAVYQALNRALQSSTQQGFVMR